MLVFIYGLFCPIERTVRYVGKSINPEKRLRGHLSGAKRRAYNHHTARLLRHLLDRGLEPRLVILHEVKEGERWQDVERELIATAENRGWRLTNSTAGGEGLDYRDPAAARRYRRKLSAAMKELWNRPERRAEARARSIAVAADPKLLAKRARAISEAFKRPECRARLRAATKEINSRPEVREAKSAASQANWADPVYRERVMRGFDKPGVKEAQAAKKRASWANPETRERIRAARWTDEARAAQAKRIAKINKRPLDPEMVKRRNASIKAAWARRKQASE